MSVAEEDIRRLLSRVARACDDRDAGALERLFAPDAVLHSQARNRAFEGRTAVIEYLAGPAAPAGAVRHFYANTDIEIDGTTAEVTSDVLVVAATHDIIAVARHVDTLENFDGSWRLRTRRSLMIDAPPPQQ